MAKYFMPGPDDGLLRGALTWARTGKRPRPSFPHVVQFQTVSACNARCAFCAHGSNPEEIKHGRMEDALIEKIIAECSRNFVGRMSPFLTNEPLLDKRMPAILAAIRKAFWYPVKTKINTNAALLTIDVGRKLLDARLSRIVISVNGYSPESYRQAMGLDFETTMGNINAFLDLKKTLGARRPKVIISTLKTNLVEHELEKAREYWAARDVKFDLHHLDNRVGEEIISGIRRSSDVFKYNRNCDFFMKHACIVENGDMIICCHDWRQSVVVGNISRTSIAEVWNSDHFRGLIYDFYAEKFDRLEICRNCG